MTNAREFASVLRIRMFACRDAVQRPLASPIIDAPFKFTVRLLIPLATHLSLPCLIWKIVHVGSR